MYLNGLRMFSFPSTISCLCAKHLLRKTLHLKKKISSPKFVEMGFTVLRFRNNQVYKIRV